MKKMKDEMSAFRAVDAFAVEAYRAAGTIRQAALGEEIRRAAVRSGAALVAASACMAGSRRQRDSLERARDGLHEGRYFIYIARRFGMLDTRRYRALNLRQDAALRELQLLLRGPEESRGRDP
jgi:hypothetical protein